MKRFSEQYSYDVLLKRKIIHPLPNIFDASQNLSVDTEDRYVVSILEKLTTIGLDRTCLSWFLENILQSGDELLSECLPRPGGREKTIVKFFEGEKFSIQRDVTDRRIIVLCSDFKCLYVVTSLTIDWKNLWSYASCNRLVKDCVKSFIYCTLGNIWKRASFRKIAGEGLQISQTYLKIDDVKIIGQSGLEQDAEYPLILEIRNPTSGIVYHDIWKHIHFSESKKIYIRQPDSLDLSKDMPERNMKWFIDDLKSYNNSLAVVKGIVIKVKDTEHEKFDEYLEYLLSFCLESGPKLIIELPPKIPFRYLTSKIHHSDRKKVGLCFDIADVFCKGLRPSKVISEAVRSSAVEISLVRINNSGSCFGSRIYSPCEITSGFMTKCEIANIINICRINSIDMITY